MINVTDGDFEEQVLKSELPVLVDFWADWCAPCNMIAPTVEEIAREYDGRLKVCKMNIDKDPKTAVRYGIRSIPSLLIFKNGQLIDHTVGVVSKKRLEENINEHIS